MKVGNLSIVDTKLGDAIEHLDAAKSHMGEARKIIDDLSIMYRDDFRIPYDDDIYQIRCLFSSGVNIIRSHVAALRMKIQAKVVELVRSEEEVT